MKRNLGKTQTNIQYLCYTHSVYIIFSKSCQEESSIEQKAEESQETHEKQSSVDNDSGLMKTNELDKNDKKLVDQAGNCYWYI